MHTDRAPLPIFTLLLVGVLALTLGAHQLASIGADLPAFVDGYLQATVDAWTTLAQFLRTVWNTIRDTIAAPFI